MNEILYLSYPARMEGHADKVCADLTNKGFRVERLLGQPHDGSLVLLLLDMASKSEEIFASAPWLKEQFDYSSFKALRLMPFLLYSSSLGSVEDQVEERLSDTLEEVVSGEFKPYGYDLDADDPLLEFPSVLETYEE